MIQSTNKNGVPGVERGLERVAVNDLDENLPRIIALAIVTMGILIMPLSHLLSTRPHLQSSIFLKKEPPLATATNAVLAVDALGLMIEMKNAHAEAHERFQSVALQNLARLHRIYSTWAREKEDLLGSLHLRLKVDASGAVVGIDPLAAQLTNTNFIHAVIAEVRSWQFPGGVADSAEITVPLLFVPRGMDPNTAVQWQRNLRRAEGSGKAVTGLRIASSATIASPDPHVSKPLPSAAASKPAEKTQPAPVRLPQVKTENGDLVALKTNQPVPLREQPRFSSKSVHELEGDTLLTLVENRGDWLKVKSTGVGSIGFLRKEFVSPSN